MSSEHEKSLELRIAAIEDKLSHSGVSQEELRAYQKVASLAGGGASTELSPQLCSNCFHCVISIPVSIPIHVHTGIAIAQQAEAQRSNPTGFEKLGQ